MDKSQVKEAVREFKVIAECGFTVAFGQDLTRKNLQKIISVSDDYLSGKLVEAMSEDEIEDIIWKNEGFTKNEVSPGYKEWVNKLAKTLSGKVVWRKQYIGTVDTRFTCSRALSIEAIEKINKIIDEDTGASQ